MIVIIVAHPGFAFHEWDVVANVLSAGRVEQFFMQFWCENYAFDGQSMLASGLVIERE